jgi:hypothetical protein
MDNISKGIGKIVHLCGEIGKHNHIIKALMETTEQSTLQFLLIVLNVAKSFNHLA